LLQNIGDVGRVVRGGMKVMSEFFIVVAVDFILARYIGVLFLTIVVVSSDIARADPPPTSLVSLRRIYLFLTSSPT